MDRDYSEQFGIDKEKIFYDAQKILDDLGLTLEELLKRKKALDLGASTAALEKAASLSGFPEKIVSLSLEVPNQVKNLGLKYVKGQASRLPFRDSTFDLVISRNGPLYLEEKQYETEVILNEMLRVAMAGGENRIYPARFGFIKRQLFDQNPEYFNLHSKAPAQRSIKEIERMDFFNSLADKKTKDYLFKEGLKFEIGKSENNSANYILLYK